MEENLAPTSDPARIVPSSEAGAGAGSSSTSIGFSTAISASTKALLEESASGGVDKATWAFAPGSASLDWCYHAALRETRRFNLLSARGLLDARGVVGVDSGRFGDDGGLGLGAAHEAGLVGLFSRFEQGSLALSIDEFLDRVKGLGRDSGLDEGALTGLSRLVGLLIAGVTAEAVRRRWRMRQLGRVPGEAALIGDGASYFPGLPGLPPRWGLHET